MNRPPAGAFQPASSPYQQSHGSDYPWPTSPLPYQPQSPQLYNGAPYSPGVGSSPKPSFQPNDFPRTRVTLLPNTRKKIAYTLVFPALLVALFAVIIPVALIVYIWRNFLDWEGWNYVVVEESAPQALSISQVGSHLISTTVTPLMGVVAAVVARDWLLSQSVAPVNPSLTKAPTPAQYSLLMKMIISANLASLRTSLSYVFTPSSRRSRIPSPFVKVLALLFFAFFISHGVGLFDFLLHTFTRSVVVSANLDSILQGLPLPYGRTMNLTTCPIDVINSHHTPCQSNSGESAIPTGWGDTNLLFEGGQAVSNTSTQNLVLSLPDSSTGQQLAIITSPNIDPGTYFTVPTVAMSAQCVTINAKLCNVTGGSLAHEQVSYNCGAAGYPQIAETPDPTSTADHSQPTFTVQLPDDIATQNSSAPVFVWAKLVFSGGDESNDTTFFSNVFPNAKQNILFACNLTSYTASISSSSNTFTLHSTTQLSWNHTFGLLGPLWNGIDIPYRMNTLAQTFVLGMSGYDFAGIFSREFAKYNLAWSAGLFQNTFTDSQGGTISTLATKYPLPYLTVLIALYGAYFLVAVVVACFASFVSSDSVLVRNPDGKEETVSLLTLVQLRLTEFFPLVVDLFSGRNGSSQTNGHAATRTKEDPSGTSTSVRWNGMFKEDSLTSRIWIGVDQEQERFGMKLVG